MIPQSITKSDIYVFQVTEFPEQNEFGLKNIIGNVWEWTQDWWEAKFTPTPKKNPVSGACIFYRCTQGVDNVNRHCIVFDLQYIIC